VGRPLIQTRIGITDKLWFMCKQWPDGSTCSLLLDGDTSEQFGISRSIKQGGSLSMLFFTVAYHNIDNSKLSFLRRLVSVDVGTITKHVFMHQLYNSVLNNNECRNNLTTDVILTTRKYNLLNYLLSYIRGGTFPHKNAWKSIINDQVYIVEETKWKNNLIKKGAVQFSNIQTRLKPSIIYQVIKRDLHNKDKYMLLQLSALPEIDLPLTCGLCNNYIFNVVEHMITSCTAPI
jgi:hypothetical protein